MSKFIQFDLISDWIVKREDILNKGKTLGFVPTMGALHEGHLSLIKQSQKENDFTLVTIFVNPTQFNDPKDFEKYPITLESDIQKLKNIGDIILLTPFKNDIYPDNYHYKVIEDDFSKKLCGKSRPGHFDGVLTVVLKLLNIAGAKVAYFGEKDFQQLTLIQNMAKAFFLPTKIKMGETVRDEKSGLALSSRNALLSNDGRIRAGEFNKILKNSPNISIAKENLLNLDFEIDYIEELPEIPKRRFGAVKLEGIRLIDNVVINGH